MKQAAVFNDLKGSRLAVLCHLPALFIQADQGLRLLKRSGRIRLQEKIHRPVCGTKPSGSIQAGSYHESDVRCGQPLPLQAAGPDQGTHSCIVRTRKHLQTVFHENTVLTGQLHDIRHGRGSRKGQRLHRDRAVP